MKQCSACDKPAYYVCMCCTYYFCSVHSTQHMRKREQNQYLVDGWTDTYKRPRMGVLENEV